MGDPFLRALLLRLANDGLRRGGPIIEDDGLLADFGRRSCGGESSKHSPNDIDVVVDSLLLPAPIRRKAKLGLHLHA